MAADLKLSSNDYSLALSIFFVGYLLLEVPSNMILSRTRPSIYLPSIMVSTLIIVPSVLLIQVRFW
jgi:fucose permease